ncbi:glutathione transferase GST 23 [Citrus sinensis]|uniref:probable glutathione S-transferase n=1 Tax=Citrus sinensis TaxID=2711 RepID=UPI002195C36C|nr:probable glutathione S-transferase [Citrus sinensis]KAH9650504.1 glutathione transferase GST 23 [Citrus sinensis]
MAEVKLLGGAVSPFVYRVIWALKLKGVPFEFVEVDVFSNEKSALLLKYNPVHKKIPVLVHGGKPVCDSTVILEYIEEKWPYNRLLPSDPYDRALARFWIKFGEDKGVAVWRMFHSNRDQESRMKAILEMLQTIEEHGLREKKIFHGDKIGLLDIAFGSMLYWLQILEDIVGVQLFDPHKFPGLNAWFEIFKKAPVIEENLPDQDRISLFFKCRREKWLTSA